MIDVKARFPSPPLHFGSRLIFRNLPSTLSNDQFRTALATPPTLKGTVVTDTKLVTKRRFAFVGYRTEEDAKRAQQWFDGSFSFGGGKVKVEVVRDEDLKLGERPAKRIRGEKGEMHKVEKRGKEGATGKGDNSQEDGEEETKQPEAGPSKSLQEFMQVMKGDDPTAPAPAEAPVKETKKGKERDTTPPPAQAQGPEDDDDAAWLARRKGNLGGLDDVEGGDDALAAAIPQDPDTALILSTARLFLRNLSFTTTPADLRTLFSPFGALEEVHIPQAKTGEPLGTAFLLFREPAAALAAFKQLDKKSFQGRLLHILPGRAKPGQSKDMTEVTEGAVLGKVKDTRAEVVGKKEEKRKGETARGVNWASLYMNSDAVAASVAAKMGISKSDLLSSDASGGSSAAVKLALAETAVIADTKKYFLDAGISLDSLSPRVPRSQTILLIKNIPHGTSIHTLTDLFSPHGAIVRLLLPPSGTLGVVEYKHAKEAQSAFKGLSYKRIGSAVLYLEKGPQGMFGEGATKGVQQSAEDKEKAELTERAAAAAGLSTASAAAAAGPDGDKEQATAGEALREGPSDSDEAGSTLFLKNLAFSTSALRLQSVLSSLPGFSFARVQTQPDPKRPGEKLSMGYGFVGFTTKDAAKKGLKALEGFEVDGKILEPRFAQRGAEDVERETSGKSGKGDKEGDNKKSTKLLVKNLPFEATKKDVRELFSAYGTLKSLRLPRKPTLTSTGAQSGRGFAFCEFTSHAEAQRAMDALKHTHLLGRHLVIQWAQQGDGVDVDALREKVGRDVRGMEGFDKAEAGGKVVGTKGKRKFELGGGREEDDGLEG